MLATYALYGDRVLCASHEDTMCVRRLLAAYPKTFRLPDNLALEVACVSIHHRRWSLDTSHQVQVNGR